MDTVPIYCRPRALALVAALLITPFLAMQSGAEADTGSPAAGTTTSPKLLEALAREAAEREFSQLSAHQRLVVGPIEPHSELAKCQGAIRATLTSPHHMQDRATFEV